MTTLKPEPSLEKHKSKGRAGRSFPVTFVVDQQLEACVDAITRTENQPDLMIKVPYNARKADSVAFSAILFQDGVALRRVKGTLRRWNGTSTRVEATMTTLNAPPMLTYDEFLFAMGISVLYIIIPFILMGIVPLDMPWLTSFLCVFIFSSIPAAILFQVLRRDRVRRKHIRLLRDALTAEPEGRTTL